MLRVSAFSPLRLGEERSTETANEPWRSPVVCLCRLAKANSSKRSTGSSACTEEPGGSGRDPADYFRPFLHVPPGEVVDPLTETGSRAVNLVPLLNEIFHDVGHFRPILGRESYEVLDAATELPVASRRSTMVLCSLRICEEGLDGGQDGRADT